MRINHNLASLNTYRQLSANSANGAKSLEKLSSGLRINKAGDDAAGLAISEKMRGQIRGLDQAGRNAQDGISLIQTAEGGLSETQSILQRMKELATQSANGTNTTSDRDEIQKEMNQLSSEINRIGNTTEFNTQKLLNGGGVKVDVAITTTTAGAGEGEIAGVTADGAFNISTINSSTAEVAKVWQNTAAVTTGDGTATYTFQGVSISLVSAGAGNGNVISGVTSNSATLTVGSTTTAANIATSLASAFSSIKTAGGDTSAIKDFTFDNSGGVTKLTITADNAGSQYNSDTVTFAAGATGTTFAADAGTAGVDEVRGEYAFSIDKAFEAVGTTIQIPAGGETFTAVASDATGNQFNVGTDANEQALNLAKAINSNTTLNVRFDALVEGSKITLREKVGEATGTNVATGTLGANTQVAGVSSFSVDELVAAGGKYEVDGVDIEVTDDATNAGIANGTAVLFDSTKNGQADKLKAAISANAELSAKYTASVSNTTITLTQKAGEESIEAPEVSTNTNSKNGYEAKLQIGANYAQSMTVNVVDMRANAMKITGDGTSTTVTAADGAKASYVATANVTDGTTNESVEFSLDVSTHEKATAAISVLDDAIASVSAERSKLGAFQNRLEHTISNLGTTSENLTASESRIRDVDMAKEMMEFTKNNILSQAAQAMLAQANQQPQGVLQLLR